MPVAHEVDYDRFEAWLAHMDDMLESFLASLPDAVRTKLDFSPASLDTLEAWLLQRYPAIADSRPEFRGRGFERCRLLSRRDLPETVRRQMDHQL
jgi:hypothetical protein